MALSLGSNEVFSPVVCHHFQPGMEELMSFAQSLIEARTDLSTWHKMKRYIERASQEMNEALEELKRDLGTIDAKSAQLVAQKKCLEDERQAQSQQLSNFRQQLDSHRNLESKSQWMLEAAQRHLEEMQQQLSKKEEEIHSANQIRDIGFGLMFIPLLGPIIGVVNTALGTGTLRWRLARRNKSNIQNGLSGAIPS